MTRTIATVTLVALGVAVTSTGLAEQQIKQVDVPKAVLDAAAANYAKARMLGFAREEEAGKTVYEVELELGPTRIDLIISPEGRILIEERTITQQELPAAVRKGWSASRYARAPVKRIEKVTHSDRPAAPTFEIVVTHQGQEHELVFAHTGELTKDEAKPAGDATPTGVKPPDVAARFRGLDACFVLYDLKSGTTVLRHNAARCAQRVPACSTFKVPLALAGFDAGVLADERTPFKWDGTKYPIDSWNADQTAATWLRNSTVWVSQVIATRLGAPKLQRYLAEFDYGSQDLSGGLTTAWLTISPTVPRPTLTISVDEQIRFLARMWRGQLKVSPRALALTQELILVETSKQGSVLHGKTGSGLVGPRHDLRLGWFVAHLAVRGAEYVAVVSFTELKRRESYQTYAGLEARSILQGILTDLGLW